MDCHKFKMENESHIFYLPIKKDSKTKNWEKNGINFLKSGSIKEKYMNCV